MQRFHLAALILAWGMAAAQTVGPTQQNVPGELIVKCAPDSDTGRLVNRMLREDPTKLDVLDAALASLSDRVGLPLELVRITSGGELLLRLDTEDLLRRLETSVAIRPEVRTVELIPKDPEGSPLQPGGHLLVAFVEGGRTAAVLSRQPDEEAMTALVAELTGDGDIPVIGARLSDQALALYPNHPALLPLFKSRMEALSEVQYVQVNTVMGFR